MTPTPTLEEFVALAVDHDVVPVSVRVVADRETAVTVFEKLVGDQPGFLFESLLGGEQWARWSFVGWDPLATITAHDGVSRATGPVAVDLPEGDPLEVLDALTSRYRVPDLADLPPLHAGLVGYLAYDAVRYVESLPNRPPDDRGLPEMLWHLVGSLAAVDNLRQEIVLIRNVVVGDDPARDHRAAVARLERDAERLGAAHPYRPVPPPATAWTGPPPASSMTREEFCAAVEVARDHVRQGDAFQVVLSQRLAVPFAGDDFALYRALRAINPSPYLFFVRDPAVTVVGSSPEMMTRVRDGRVSSRPIAGTRPRGATPEEDAARAEELLADPKERAEHVMLVDLARNDLGRVCRYGTVTVEDLMVIEWYSHVLHIVSGVEGELRDGVGGVDVLRATFPHGTVSGAPKVRAMEIIDDLEPVARGPYAGAVGYLDFSGNVDTAICLRTVVLADDTAWVQAGAGIVYDSDPDYEYEESMTKAAAALAAVEAATDA
ncbi:MAG: anthranilate synthase component I [Acidimicrobiia bacterium]